MRFSETFSQLFVFGVGLSIVAAAQAPKKEEIHINQIQVIGTHNSYHAGFAPSAQKLWETNNPEGFKGLDYKHKALTEQFDAGVRQIELDIFADTQGGRYAHPHGSKLVADAGLPADPGLDPNGLMLKPGFKVMHMQDIDYRSNCQPFVACLKEVRAWSQAHPRLIPIFILVEMKQQAAQRPFQVTEPETFTSQTFDALDAEIRSVFFPNEMITPDEVRGSYDTLNAAILAGNWPTLRSAHGNVVFLMDQRPVGLIYLTGHPSLRGGVLFTNSTPGQPDAAFIERNDGPAADISALAKQGYLVRTRTDDSTREARTNSTGRRDAMIASGAQILSTDYPINEPARWEGHYSVSLPGDAVARCNPVNAPAGCEIHAPR